MNQEDHNKTEKNLITLLNWYRLKRVNEFAAQCDEAQAWESIQQRIRHRKRIRMYTYWSSTAGRTSSTGSPPNALYACRIIACQTQFIPLRIRTSM